MTDQLTEPDSPAAAALAQHIADHPISTVQAAFRELGMRLDFEIHEQPAAGYCPHCGRGDAGPTADEYEASQRRAVHIQTLLDDTRDRIRKLHRPAYYGGRIICAECSAYDGHTTDSPPVDHPCATAAALEPPTEAPDA